MTPELTALARAYMALPGGPVRSEFAPELLVEDGNGHARFRDRDGILWATDLADRTAPWTPDLTDRANGGVLFATIAPGWLAYQREHDGRWEVSRPDGEHRQEGATLAEAVARVAVAVGRAG